MMYKIDKNIEMTFDNLIDKINELVDTVNKLQNENEVKKDNRKLK